MVPFSSIAPAFKLSLVGRRFGDNCMGMLNTLRARRAEFKRMYRDATADESVGTFIPLRSKRGHRVGFIAGLASELPAVFTVVAAGVSAVQGERDGEGLALAAAELIAGAAVLGIIGLEARHLFGRQRGHEHNTSRKPRIGASNLAAAALGFVEAWHRAHVHGHLKLVSPQVFGAITSLIAGYLKNRPVSVRRMRRRLHVGVTPRGILYLAGVRQKWWAPWTEVAAVEHDRGSLVIRLHDGRRHVMRADDHLDGEGVLADTRAAIATHASHIPGAVSGATFSGPGSVAHAAGPYAH